MSFNEILDLTAGVFFIFIYYMGPKRVKMLCSFRFVLAQTGYSLIVALLLVLHPPGAS